jgi:hypothetical protein
MCMWPCMDAYVARLYVASFVGPDDRHDVQTASVLTQPNIDRWSKLHHTYVRTIATYQYNTGKSREEISNPDSS